jgi:hypothetical protein
MAQATVHGMAAERERVDADSLLNSATQKLRLRHPQLMSRATRPGASSQEKYNTLTRAWRRRHRKLFAVVALICGSICVLSFVAAQLFPRAGWLLGCFGGAAIAFWLIARWSPPGWIENWQGGAYGEQATAKALRALEEEGWIVLHDLRAGRGNVDHIAIGPGGVYLLDSKRLGGTVSVHGTSATVRRIDDPDLSYEIPRGHIVSLARQTHQRVLASSRINVWVTPVMVIWADFPQRVAGDQPFYVKRDELVTWLKSRPQTVAASRVQQLADVVATAWAISAPERTQIPGPARLE